MTLPIKSRHGLTRCTACRAHIRAAETPSATECPFCGANLRAAAPRSVLPSGRTSLLAASLLAMSAAGCGGAQTPADDTATSAPASSNDDNQNTNAGDDQYAPRPADDNTAVAEYGVSPDAWPEQQADDPRPTPRYGLPPTRR
jgi:predicted RNA-binding Zn-ribbon protein involved in translation (DUF1610 family)